MSANKTIKPPTPVELITDTFGIVENEKGEQVQVKRFTWKNSQRISVQAITLGATITSIKYPNKKGIIDDVILGFDEIRGYRDFSYYNFGSTIGRYASFIKNCKFTLLKRDYTLTANFGDHHVNGGRNGFDQAVWNHHVNGTKVILSHFSPDEDEGYPGDVLIFATLELTMQNEFKIEYKAMTSKPTIINIANHCYFNLNGHNTGPDEVAKHKLTINADCHTITGDDMLPTGAIQSVINTIYDFQTPKQIGTLLDSLDGFNKNFCVNRGVDQSVCFVARLSHGESGRILEVYSNQHGLLLDTANSLPSKPEVVAAIKAAKSPYLTKNVKTFDMLDEIFNRVADIMAQDEKNNYVEILDTIQDLQKKENTVIRTVASAEQNSLVKRVEMTIEDLEYVKLTSLQKRYLMRILKVIHKMADSSCLSEMKYILEKAATSPEEGDTRSSSASNKRPNEPEKPKCVRGKKGAKYTKHCGISLQTQNYPDAINNSNFPNCVLKPGTVYTHLVTYRFWVKTDESGLSGVF